MYMMREDRKDKVARNEKIQIVNRRHKMEQIEARMEKIEEMKREINSNTFTHPEMSGIK